MKTPINTKISALILVGLASFVGACAHNEPMIADQPRIMIAASNTDLVVGDTTTLTISSKNTLGREADVEWATTGGKISTEDNHRVARVKFDAPGTYTVTARLVVNKAQLDAKSVNINVRPLRSPQP